MTSGQKRSIINQHRVHTQTMIINMKGRSSKLNSDLAEVAWIKTTFLCESKQEAIKNLE